MRKGIWWIFLLIMIGIGSYTGWNLYRYWQENHQADQTFQELAEKYQKEREEESEQSEKEADSKKTTLGDVSEGVLSLKNENPDFIGWIQIEGTNINHPVMYRPDDVDYYLHRDFYGKYSKSGTPYVAEQCDVQKSDNVIIYGHNMNSGSVFADLNKYKAKDYFTKHPTIQFDTIYEKNSYQILAVFVTSVYQENTFPYYAFTKAENEEEYQEFITTCKEMALYDTGIDAEYGERLLTLSTCEYSRTNGRVVVVAKKI
jgi:sortase B